MLNGYFGAFGDAPPALSIDPQLVFAQQNSYNVFINTVYGHNGGCDSRAGAWTPPSTTMMAAARLKAQTESQSSDPSAQADYANFILQAQSAMAQVDTYSVYDQGGYNLFSGQGCGRSDGQEKGMMAALNALKALILKYANSAIPVAPQVQPTTPTTSGWIQPPNAPTPASTTPPPAAIQGPVLTAAQQAVLAAAQAGASQQQQIAAAQIAAQQTALQNGATIPQAQQSSDWVTSLLTTPGGGLSPVAIGVGIAAVLGLGYALFRKRAAPVAA